MLAATAKIIGSNSSCLVVFQGEPFLRLNWSLTGAGTLSQVDYITDERGVAKALFTPTADDQLVTVEVSYVP